MTPIKTDIVGFGRMASNRHLSAMRETELFDISAVCDITESRRKAAVEEGLTATDDIDAFLDSDLELVLITTHSSLHYESALKVAAAKKHMLIEKPLAVHGPEAEEMVQAAADNGVMLTVYHNRHFDRDYRLVKSAIRKRVEGLKTEARLTELPYRFRLEDECKIRTGEDRRRRWQELSDMLMNIEYGSLSPTPSGVRAAERESWKQDIKRRLWARLNSAHSTARTVGFERAFG